jgi:hypothetical protein
MSRKSTPLLQVWEPLAGGSLLFFPLTHTPDRDAQKGHKHQPTTNTSAGGSSEASPDPDRTPPPVQFDTKAAIALAFLLGSATALGASSVYRRFFRRIKNAEWITPDLLGGKRWITGIVTRCVLCDPASPRSIPYSSLPAHWRWLRWHLLLLCCAAWVMQITSAFTTRLALAGAAYSSLGMCLAPLEVRDHLTPPHKCGSKPITTKHDAGLQGKTIHIRMAGMDAPEVSEKPGRVTTTLFPSALTF